MKRKTLLITTVALLVAGLAFAGKGYRNDSPGRPMNGGMMDRMPAMQILTEEEQAKVQKARVEFEKKAIPLRADLKVLQIEIDQLILAGKSEKDISGKLARKNEVTASLAAERLKHQIEVRAIVGEEKYQKLGLRQGMAMNGCDKPGMKPGGNMHGGKAKGGRGQNGECSYGNTPPKK